MLPDDDGYQTSTNEHDDAAHLPTWCWIATVAAIACLLADPVLAVLVSPDVGTGAAWVSAVLSVAVAYVVRGRRVRFAGTGRWLYPLVAVIAGSSVVTINLLVRGGAYDAAVVVLVVTVPVVALAVTNLRRHLVRTSP